MDQRKLVCLVTALLAVFVFGSQLSLAAEPAPDLKSVLRDDAFGVVWVPSVGKLVESISKFVPGGGAVNAQLSNVLAEIGLPKDEALKAPVALMVLPPADADDAPHFVALIGLKPDKWLDAKGAPDKDGVYDAGNGTRLMVYKGFIAAAPERRDLLVLQKTAEQAKPLVLSEHAAKLMEKAQLFAHVNIPLILKTYEEKIKEGRTLLVEKIKNDAEAVVPEDLVTGGFDFMIKLANEVKSVDVAADFDIEGLKFTCASSVDPQGHVSRYLAAMGKPTVAPTKLPVLQQYMMACWVQADPKMIDMFLTDNSLIIDWLMKTMKTEPGKLQAIAPPMKALLEKSKGIIGNQMAMAMGFTNDGMSLAGVTDVRKPAEYRKLMTEAIATYNKILPDLMKSLADGQLDMQYMLEPDAATVAGTKVDRLKMTMTADDPEKQAAIDKAMTIYGPNGFDTLQAIVGNRALSCMGEKAMASTIALLQGNGEALNDDSTIKKLKEKLSPAQNLLCYVVPARLMEFGIAQAMKMQNRPAPNPIPFATPLAVGMRPVDAKTLACELYLPQACIMECMSAAMPMMGGGPMPPPGDQNLDDNEDDNGAAEDGEAEDAPAKDDE